MAITYIAVDGSFGDAEGLIILRDDTKIDYDMTLETMELTTDMNRHESIRDFMINITGEINYVNIGRDIEITEFPKVELQ